MRRAVAILPRRLLATRGAAGDALVWPPPESVPLPPGVREALARAADAPAPAPTPSRPSIRRSAVPTTSLVSPIEIAGWLTAAKCDDVTTLPVAGRCAFADAMVVATARSGRHALMAAEAVSHFLKERAAAAGVDAPPAVEGAGEPDADWLLVDAGATLAHVFASADARQRYGLERLWGDGGEEADDGGGDGG